MPRAQHDRQQRGEAHRMRRRRRRRTCVGGHATTDATDRRAPLGSYVWLRVRWRRASGDVHEDLDQLVSGRVLILRLTIFNSYFKLLGIPVKSVLAPLAGRTLHLQQHGVAFQAEHARQCRGCWAGHSDGADGRYRIWRARRGLRQCVSLPLPHRPLLRGLASDAAALRLITSIEAMYRVAESELCFGWTMLGSMPVASASAAH